MSDPPTTSDDGRLEATGGLPLSPTAPLLLWLAVQMLALGTSVFQVPLSDQYPRPAERMALHQVLVAQVVASSLFFPWLFRNAVGGVFITTSAWPFIQMAASLSATSWENTIAAGVYVTLWLSLLSVWGTALKTKRARHAVGASASAMALLGPILWYLGAEYGATGREERHRLLSLISPVVGVLELVSGDRDARLPIVVLAMGLPVSIGGLFWRQLIHRPSTVP
jgi:hypothetical protein